MLLYSVYIGALDLGMILKYKPGRLVTHVGGSNKGESFTSEERDDEKILS